MISSLLQQRQRVPCSRALREAARKTSLSLRQSMSTLAAAPKPIVTPKVGAVVSRRQWTKLYKPPPRQPPPKDNLDDKPWPRSVQIAGYGLAVTVIPYCIAWFIASNVTVRSALFPYFPKLEFFVRQWFGHPEEDYYSYVDYRKEGEKNLDIPMTFDYELPFKIRKEQAEVDRLLQDYPVPARIRVFTHGGFNLGEVIQMPGTTPVKMNALLEELMKDRERSIDPDSVAYVSVEFADIKDKNVKDKESNDEQVDDTVLSVHVPFEKEGNLDVTTHLADLLKSTSIYSKWHYHVALQPQQESKSSGPKRLSDHEMQVAELEHKLQELQRQLKDHTIMKSFDDIQEEISQAKSELRRLKWKRRLRIFG
mgnify:CR=1 FL=1